MRVGEVGLFCCGVWVCIVSVGFWVGDGRRWPEAVPLFPFGQILDMRPGVRRTGPMAVGMKCYQPCLIGSRPYLLLW